MASVANEEILSAARRGDCETISVATRLLGSTILNVVDEDGINPLHAACISGHLSIVQQLLSQPMHFEENLESLEVCDRMKYEARNEMTENGLRNSNHIGGQSDNLCAISQIREASSRGSTRSSESNLPPPAKGDLCPSCSGVAELPDKSSLKCCKCGSLFRGCDETKIGISAWASLTTRCGHTALHWAAIKGHKDIVDELIKSGFNVNANSKQNATPLYLASVANKLPVVAALIKAGADPTVRCTNQRTAYEAAKALNLTEICAYFTKNS